MVIGLQTCRHGVPRPPGLLERHCPEKPCPCGSQSTFAICTRRSANAELRADPVATFRLLRLEAAFRKGDEIRALLGRRLLVGQYAELVGRTVFHEENRAWGLPIVHE